MKEKGYQLIAVTTSKGSYLKRFTETFGPYPFPLYGDPSRKAFREMGHVTPAKWKLLGMAAAGVATGKVKNLFPRHPQERKLVLESMKTQDVYIQGGTWIFDEEGHLLFSHIDKTPDDHAEIREIIEVLERKG
ncbi:hypothetical protein FGB90_07530 [Alteribacter natronophilus]|nr:hypothetical protein FGB90_07530 [Alteribacter natronophilus]